SDRRRLVPAAGELRPCDGPDQRGLVAVGAVVSITQRLDDDVSRSQRLGVAQSGVGGRMGGETVQQDRAPESRHLFGAGSMMGYADTDMDHALTDAVGDETQVEIGSQI